MRVGLTGGIGSGKSTVARRLQSRGAWVVDADAISRAATAPKGAAIPLIAEVFGPEYVAADGAMDRQRMRERVFQDPSAKRTLEGIIHPIVGEQTMAMAAQAGHRPVIFDVPLLVESGHWLRRVDCVWVVDCQVDTQLRRVQERSGWNKETTEAVIRQQASREQRLAAADAVLYNDGIDLAGLASLIDDLAHRFGL
ncbi:MAG: dephospho-CoA kinase [Gammaproteobacteria bacterium]